MSSSWPGLPQQDDYGFSNSYGQTPGTQPTPSRSSQQNFSTAYTPAQSPYYHRLQATAAAAADYANEGYQAQTYGQRQPQQQQQQQRPVNDSLSYSTQWYGGNSGNTGRTAPSTGGNESLPNINTINQSSDGNSAPSTAGRSSANRVYDTTGFENLAYASAAVGYATESNTEQRRNQEVSNTGSHYGTRPLPTTTDAQSQYTQAYAQPSATSTNSTQYNNYIPQIARPDSTGSTASQSTSYSQRQTPMATQQPVQNSRTNAASYSQQQAPSYGMQTAKPTPAQPSNGYTARQTPVATSRTNQNMSADRVAQAARAYAQKQGYYNSTPSSNSNLQSPAPSSSQRQGVATSNRQAPINQRQTPAAMSPIQMTPNVHQRAPSTTSSAPQPSPNIHQRQASNSARQAPASSNYVEARSSTGSPLYLGANPPAQSRPAVNSNISHQSPKLSQQQVQNSQNYNFNNGIAPQNSTGQQSQQNLPAPNPTRNPRSLLSPTEASAKAYQSRTAGGNQRAEVQESQMQTVIDPRDLDLHPRPSPSAILEAAKLMREAEEREEREAAAAAAVKAAEAEQAQAMSVRGGAAGAPESPTAAKPGNVPSASPNSQPRESSNNTNGPLTGASRADSQSTVPLSKTAAPSTASKPATPIQTPSQASQSKGKPIPASTPQAATTKRGPVVWPESKKASLASAAITVLMSFAENAGKTITKEQIHAMLDEGPSYIEFCERIEEMGFRLDRARLAKTLLSAVSDASPAAGQASTQANSKVKVSESKRANTQRTNQSLGQSIIDPRLSGNHGQMSNNQAPKPGSIVSIAEPNGQNQITWRPLNGAQDNGAESTSIGGQEIKKRRSRKSAPEIGPDGQIIPPRPRGRPRRDGLPPKPRKSMPIQPATNSTEGNMGSSSTATAHPFSAFAYQPSASMQGPPPLNIDNPRSPFLDRNEPSEPPVNDWRARHAQALKERWDSMGDKPRNFPYPESPPVQENRDDVENRLLAALGDGHDAMASENGTYFGANIPQRQAGTRDLHTNGETSTEPVAPSSTNKRNANGKTSTHAQQNHQSNSLQEQQQPLTKEMAARKRNFSELIDLTDDKDPADAPNKFRRVDNATNENLRYGEGQLPIATFSNPHAHPLPPSLQDPQRAAINGAGQIVAPGFIKQQREFLGSDSPQISGRNSPNPYEHFEHLCKPIDKNLALRKSEYNPKTIARDVLIAVNRHPTQRGINAHLEILKKKFPKQVNNRSDLSTFRWDIVDPGGLPVGSENMQSNDEHKTPKPFVRLHPSLPGSSMDHQSPQSAPAEIPSAFNRPVNPISTTPSSEVPSAFNFTRPANPVGMTPSSEGPSAFKRPAVPEFATPSSEGPSAFKRPAIPVNTTPARPSHLRNEASGPSGIASASPRGRGRPPKDRTGELSKGFSSVPPKDRTGESSKAASSVHDDSFSNPTAKKRGRPFKSAESALKAAVKQQRLSTGELQPGRRGRPPKALVGPSKVADPKYISFDCEWRDCKAELQNLETLRQHVFTVHSQPLPEGGICCRWINCGKKGVVTDQETGESRAVDHDLILPDVEKFKKHIEKRHMPAYAWNLGDGPKGSELDGYESDITYLSDANGKQVTPSIADQEVVADHRHRSDSLTTTVNKNGEPRKKVGRPRKDKPVAQSGDDTVMDEADAARSAS